MITTKTAKLFHLNNLQNTVLPSYEIIVSLVYGYETLINFNFVIYLNIYVHFILLCILIAIYYVGMMT